MTDKLPERVRREVERIRSMQNEHGDVLARQYLADEIVKLRASCLASENNGGWRKYPEYKPTTTGPFLTFMDEEPDMGHRIDACHYMPDDIPGQTEGWGTPLFYDWANHKVLMFLPEPDYDAAYAFYKGFPAPHIEHKETER